MFPFKLGLNWQYLDRRTSHVWKTYYLCSLHLYVYMISMLLPQLSGRSSMCLAHSVRLKTPTALPCRLLTLKLFFSPISRPSPVRSPSIHQTGNSLFLLVPTLSSAHLTHGPTTGTFPAYPPIVTKKSPNSTAIPYSSTQNPISAHRSKMSMMPATKAAVPLSLFRRAKKSTVFCGPMIRGRPMRKRI